jgi:aminoglycoside phosphotransferase (APT) family kinase protein
MADEKMIPPETIPIRDDEDFDHDVLAAYLRGQLPGSEQPLQIEQFGGGHANLTYLLRYGAHEYVLRRPPLGPVAATAHDMGREFRVLSVLYRVIRWRRAPTSTAPTRRSSARPSSSWSAGAAPLSAASSRRSSAAARTARSIAASARC